MTGEDVYDAARKTWCHICDADHEDCEPPDIDLDYECCRCHKRLSDKRHDAGELFCARCERTRP